MPEPDGKDDARRMGSGLKYTLISAAQVIGALTVIYTFAAPHAKTWAQEFIVKAMDAQIGKLTEAIEAQTAIIEQLQESQETPRERDVGEDATARLLCLMEAQAREEDPLLRCGQ